MITKLTLALFRKALKDAASWPDCIRLSFNLSALDVNSSLSFLSIISALEASDVLSSRIVFEVTETAVMRDLKQAHEALTILKQTGARIALDDFGTGFSSLSCIQELPLDKIKIDRSFIGATNDDPSSSIILRSMINLCHNLELECVVEGVENLEQMNLLQREGCQYLQGYLFAEPMSGERIVAYLAAGPNFTGIASRTATSTPAFPSSQGQ